LQRHRKQRHVSFPGFFVFLHRLTGYHDGNVRADPSKDI
jgi:hypothetical protein